MNSCKTENGKNIDKVIVDQLFINGIVYTVDQNFAVAEAMAIDKGKIVFVGTTVDAQNMFSSKAITNLQGAVVYPGFVDGHCHFLGYARTLFNVDLTETTSIEEI